MQIDKQCMRSLFVVSILILHGCAMPRERLRYITGTKAKVEEYYQRGLIKPYWKDNESRRISCEDVYILYNPWMFDEITQMVSSKRILCKFTDLGDRFIKYLENVNYTQGLEPVLFCNCTYNVIKVEELSITVEETLRKKFHIMNTENATGYFELEEREDVDNGGRALFRPSLYYLYDRHCNWLGNRTSKGKGKGNQLSPKNPNRCDLFVRQSLGDMPLTANQFQN